MELNNLQEKRLKRAIKRKVHQRMLTYSGILPSREMKKWQNKNSPLFFANIYKDIKGCFKVKGLWGLNMSQYKACIEYILNWEEKQEIKREMRERENKRKKQLSNTKISLGDETIDKMELEQIKNDLVTAEIVGKEY